jgi:hypothetical protein
MGRLSVLVALLALFGCTYNPNYNGIHCGENRECPEGYTCIGPDESGLCLKLNPVDAEGEDGGVGDGDAGRADIGDGDPGTDRAADGGDGCDGGDGVPADDGPDCPEPDFDGDNYDSLECGGSDCDDEDASVNPGAPEVCDGVDNDCDGDTDGMTRGCELTHQGICAVGEETCEQGVWAGCPPAGEELCDPPGADEDCDGSVDEGCECIDGQTRDCPVQDGVCSGAQETCVDYQWPGCDYAAYSQDYETIPEQSCDGLDNDCDGGTDGMSRSCNITHVGRCAVGVETCTDSVWAGCPLPAQEECDGIDNDCDDELDAADGDLLLTECEFTAGVCAGDHRHDPSKCIDGQWQFCGQLEYGPDYGPELCADGLDNDCDGLVDCGPEECEGDTMTCYNECLPGQQTCLGGAWTACDAPAKADETPENGNCGDDLDNDCNGSTDCEEAACDGFERVCYKVCHQGHQHCENGSWTECDAHNFEEEKFGCFCCSNGIDDDCDGKTDWDDPDC